MVSLRSLCQCMHNRFQLFFGNPLPGMPVVFSCFCVSFQFFFLNGISSLSQLIISAVVHRKLAASVSFDFFQCYLFFFHRYFAMCCTNFQYCCTCYAWQDISAMVYRVCHLFIKTYSHPHLLGGKTVHVVCQQSASSYPFAFASWLARIEFIVVPRSLGCYLKSFWIGHLKRGGHDAQELVAKEGDISHTFDKMNDVVFLMKLILAYTTGLM